jgi:hypothetical protein
MPSLMQLWAPILLSAFLVFLGSSLVHMVFKWHNPDYRKLSNEDEVRAVLRKGSPAPGQYVVPHCIDPKEMSLPENKQKWIDGPVGMMYIMPNGITNMGAMLGKWFVFNIVVAIFVAYTASHSLPLGTAYLTVYRVVGTITFLAYAAGAVPDAIWMGKPWTVALKQVGDGFFYALLVAGAFGWLWPRG